MIDRLGFLGFGEAAPAIAEGLSDTIDCELFAFDIAAPASPATFQAKATASQVTLVNSPAALAKQCDLILSLVTCTDVVRAAESLSPHFGKEHTYVDLNSCSPQAKEAASESILASGASYIDGAVMAGVPPYRHEVPILVCGTAATEVCEELGALGMRVDVVGGKIGAASAMKMCRSIVLKGIQGLLLECVTASNRFGVENQVLDSIQESFPGINWHELANYFFTRSIVHGRRQAHEMEEVVKTLAAVGMDPHMATGTAARLRDYDALDLAQYFGDEIPEGFQDVLRVMPRQG